MKTLHILVGAQGSGKSKWSYRQLLEDDSIVWLESDVIRKELFNDLKSQDKQSHEKVFKAMNKRLKQSMSDGKHTIIYDATNTSRKRRSALYSMAKKFGYDVEIDLFLKTYHDLVASQATRDEDKFVKANVIKRTYMSIQPPKIGYDCDRYVLKQAMNNDNMYLEISKNIMSSHESPYHKETIFEHINMTIVNAYRLYKDDEHYSELNAIATMHDWGKSFCLTEEKPERPDLKWFYEYNNNKFYRFNNHQNVSAMYAMNLLLEVDKEVTKNNLIIEGIYQHMQAHKGFDDKYINKYNMTYIELDIINKFAKVDSLSKIKDEYVVKRMNEIRKEVNDV